MTTGIKQTVTDIKKNCNGEYFVYLDMDTDKVSGGPDQFFPRENVYLIMQREIRIHGVPTMQDVRQAVREAKN